MTIWAFRGRRALVRMRRRDWKAMIAELGVRGRGDRESGAFLLADQSGDRRRVTKVVYLDDLDPNCLQGAIHLDGRVYSKLWDICDAEALVVIADVHTHPGSGVRQSVTDAENPMVAQSGHVAVIVPDYAGRYVRKNEIGVHRYEGDAGWTTWTGSDAADRFFVRRLV
jgi:proteasome lid subunit RPN8/RPN11